MTNIEKAILKKTLLNNSLAFTRYFFYQRKKQRMILNRHHYLIGQTLDRVFKGEIKRLIVNIAPRYTKTEQVVISFIANGFAINPSSEFIHASYADSLALKNSMIIKDLIAHESYKSLFNLEFKKDSKSKKSWRIEGHDGGLLAVSSGGTITGFGAGLMKEGFTGALIIDDPIKPQDAYSDVVRDKVNQQINDTFMSRLAHKDVPVIIVMQRLHEDDTTGFLLGGGTGEKWHHLCLPCEITDESKVYNYDINPYGIPIEHNLKNGALWPYKHTLEDLEMMKKSHPYSTASQLYQSPAPLGGGIFKDEFFNYWPNNIQTAFEYKFITADTAQKTKEHNDRSAIACWGVKNNNLYLIDLVCGRWESPDLKRVFIEFHEKHKTATNQIGNMRYVYIEDKSSGTDMIQNLKNDMNIIAVQRNKDKFTRAQDALPYLVTGKVFLPEKASFIHDFKMELRSFTPLMTHKHDDQVDVLLDAVQIALMQPKKVAGTF